MVADEGGDDKGNQAVGANDQSVLSGCGTFHLSKPKDRTDKGKASFK